MCWRLHPYVWHCDIKEMYNVIKSIKKHWCLQRYLFEKELDQDPEERVIKTIIYGCFSSGNQAQCTIRKLAALFKQEYPDIHNIVKIDLYMDDCMSGGHSLEDSVKKQNDLQYVLSQGDFELKGFSVSGQPPDESLTLNGVNIITYGNLWNPLDDTIALNVKPINFAKKVRGKKTGIIDAVPKSLTKRHCAAKAGELFDFNGLIVPLIGSIRLDLHDLSVRKLSWDDALPDSLREVWCSHFQMIEEIKTLKWQRAVIPVNAVNLENINLPQRIQHELEDFKSKHDETSIKRLISESIASIDFGKMIEEQQVKRRTMKINSPADTGRARTISRP